MKYGTWNIANFVTILSELHERLDRFQMVPVSDMFRWEVIAILTKFQDDFPVDEDVAEEFDVDYERLTPTYNAVGELIENDVVPISSEGRLMALLHSSGEDTLKVIELWTDDVFDIDYLWNRIDNILDAPIVETWMEIDTREKILNKIEQLQRIFEFDKLDKTEDELSEEDELVYLELLEKYKENKEKNLLRFSYFLKNLINQLDELLEKKPAIDNTKIQEFEENDEINFDENWKPIFGIVEEDKVVAQTGKWAVITWKPKLKREELQIVWQ